MTVSTLTYHAAALGLPVNGVDFTLEAFTGLGQRQVFYGTSHLLAPFEGTSDANGDGSITNVPANADTSDPSSYYLFTARGETADGLGYEASFPVVVPTGGATYDISTLSPPAPPVVPGSIGLAVIDAAGDLLAGTGPDAIDNLPIGSNGQVLTVDTAQSMKMKWAAAGGGISGIVVQEADVTVAAAATTIDFGAGFDVTESPANEANIALDLSELTHNSLGSIGANDHHAQAHTLASHSTKAHSELTGVGADDHHAQAHTLASHSTKAHSELTGVGVDDHHLKVHDHSGTEGQIVVGGLPNDVVTYAKMQNVTSGRFLGRTTAGPGDAEELSVTSELTLALTQLSMTASGHGASKHTDITRSVWCSASNMPGNNTDGSALTGGGTLPDRLAFFTLADAATQGAYFNFLMPKDAVAGAALTAVVYWTPASTDAVAHTVRWSADTLAMVAGTSHSAAGTTTTWTGDSAARTTLQMVIETGVQVLAVVSADDLIRFDIRRIGADGADTYVGIVNLVGVRFEYTATG